MANAMRNAPNKQQISKFMEGWKRLWTELNHI